MRYAGFWRRGAAMIIDGVLVTLVGLLAMVPFPPGIGMPNLESASPEELRGAVARMLIEPLVWVGIWVVYFAAFESSARQATPGKMALGIVVAGESGQRIGFGQALARNAAKSVSSAILSIGFLMAAFTSRKQALHDIMTGCLVLRR